MHKSKRPSKPESPQDGQGTLSLDFAPLNLQITLPKLEGPLTIAQEIELSRDPLAGLKLAGPETLELPPLDIKLGPLELPDLGSLDLTGDLFSSNAAKRPGKRARKPRPAR